MVGWMGAWVVACSVEYLVENVAGYLVVRSVDRSVGWLLGRCAKWSAGRSVDGQGDWPLRYVALG